MYKLNNISLSDYGFIPTQSDKSNLALKGCWSMPKRMGKTYHSWGDEHGIEPYVEDEEIRFEGRDFKLTGIIRGTDKLDALDKLQDFYKLLDSFESLVDFSCDWGLWEVYIKKEIKAKYVGDGVVTLTIEMREPVLNLLGELERPTNLRVDHATWDVIDLVWDDNPTLEIGYLIQGQDENGAWVDLGTVAQNVTEFSDEINIVP